MMKIPKELHEMAERAKTLYTEMPQADIAKADAEALPLAAFVLAAAVVGFGCITVSMVKHGPEAARKLITRALVDIKLLLDNSE